MRTRVVIILAFAIILGVVLAFADYQAFTPSAYWTNVGTFPSFSTSFVISQSGPPDSTSDYQVTSTILSTCSQGGVWYDPWWEMDHHLLRATSDYNGTQGSAYDIVYDTNRCGAGGDPHLYVYKVVNGSATILLNVVLAGSQAGQSFVSFIRQDGSNPGIHIKLGFNEWHISDTSLTSGYPGVATTNGVTLMSAAYREIDRTNPSPPSALQTAAWPTVIDVQWTASTDAGSGLTRYLLYKNGTYIASAPAGTNTYSFGGLTSSTSYTFTVVAQDVHLNVSSSASVTTSTTAHTPNVPVVPTRLGIHRFSQSWGAGDLGEAVDTMSGNLNFTAPAFSMGLRGGGSIPFAFIYNAQLWRKDGSLVKRLGGDLGYGHGWRLQAGAITPIWNGSAFSHFVFTDATGAEYNLATNTNGVWTGKDGAYVSYDQNTRRLWFNSGIFWQMDCISGSTEVDAGSRYPTRIQNANGNYADITYKPAIGSSSANTSARIENINDLRGQMAYITYNSDAIPHATNINSVYAGQAHTFTYTAGTLVDPFTGGSYGTQKQLTALSVASTPAGSAYTFAYNPSGELTNVVFPKGGELRYNYTTTTLANSITMRELADRRLVKQAGATEVVYNLVRDAADSSQVMHSSLSLTDPSGVGRKRWLFSTANDYTRGFLTQYFEHPTATGNTNILRQHTYSYTQDSNQMPYVQSVTTDLDPGTTDAKTMKTDQTVDNYGNVTQSQLYEYGNLTVPARTTNCTYYFPGVHYLRSLPQSCNTTDGTNTVNLFTTAYDNYGAGNPLTQVTGTPTQHATAIYNTTYTARGNVTSTSSPGKSTYLTYNVLGEVIGASTNGQTVQWNYSSSNNFGAPTSLTPNSNANLQLAMNWNTMLQPTGSSSPNGNSTGTSYDSVNRPVTQVNGDGLSTSISYFDNVNQSVAYPPSGPSVRTTYDGLGRPIKTENIVSAGVLSTVDTEYDSCACSPAGKLKRQSMPYASGGTVLWTTYVYDGLGRTLQVIQPHTSGTGSAGTTTYAYAGNKVTVTDPAGRWKRYVQTAVGNLVQVTEPNPAGGANFETYYTYNLRNQLTLVQMPRPDQIGGTYTQTRTFVYDSTTAQLTSATNPENGTTTYNYSYYGQLNYKQDAKGQRIEYTYDANNRVTKITPRKVAVYPATTGDIEACNVVEYFYDLTANTYGRLSAVQYGSKDNDSNWPFAALCPKGLQREEFTYTNGGRPTSKTLKLTRKFADISNAELTAQMAIQYDYNTGTYPYQSSSPLLQKVTYPTTYTQTYGGYPVSALAGPVYQYSYDGLGRPIGETRQDPVNGTSTLVDQVTYNTFGALTQMRKATSGGSQTETRSYDAFQRMTSMTTFDGTAIAYNYSQTANDGKLVSQVTGSETVNYTYDSLGRLSTAQTADAGGWGMSWMYDGWGNRLQQAALKGSVPTMVSTTDPTTNRIQSHTYDANGNTVYTPQQGNMTYDVFNRLKTVASDTYSYDPSNKRVWKNDEYTFWGAGGERIGRYTAVKLIQNDTGTPIHFFVFQKVLVDEYFGARRLTSQDQQGSVGQYYPYGEAKSGAISNADSFATYYRDSTGLDYADQRFYHPGVSRFVTADPYLASAGKGDPSSWNRYTYTRGDPINSVDPIGLQDCPVTFCVNGYGRIYGSGGSSGGGGGGSGNPPTEEQVGIGDSGGVQMDERAWKAAQTLWRAFDLAMKALNSDKCKSLFGNESSTDPNKVPTPDPKKVLAMILNGGDTTGGSSPYGRMVLDDIVSKPGTTTSATAAVWTYKAFDIGNGATQLMPSTVLITINSMAGNFVDGNVTEAAATLIHELGHAFYALGSLGGSSITPDGGDTKKSEANQDKVKKNCF